MNITEAIEENNLEIVKELIAAGADVSSKDGNGRTPLELAIDKGHLEIAECLKEYGAKK